MLFGQGKIAASACLTIFTHCDADFAPQVPGVPAAVDALAAVLTDYLLETEQKRLR